MQFVRSDFRRVRTLALAISVLLALAACGSELPSPALIDKFRLLALSTDTPDVLDGFGATVTATWIDGSSRAGRPVHFLWRLCREGSDLEPRTCIRNDASDEVLRGTAEMGASALTLDPSRLGRVNDRDTTYIVMLAACPDSAPEWNANLAQFDCPSERAIVNERREGVMAFRRLSVRTAVQNRVPGIDHVEIGGRVPTSEQEPLPVARCTVPTDQPCPTVSLRLVAAPGSDEVTEPPARETMLASFFFTAGRVDRPRAVGTTDDPLGVNGSLSAEWTPPREAQTVQFVFVLRDGRGGDAVRRATVAVR